MLGGIIPKSELKQFTARDGTGLFYREWEGRKHKNVVIYLHGLESHMGWFMETGNFLNRKGFHVYAVDRRGSGMSQVNRGHIDSYKTFLEDIKEMVELAREEHPGKRIYLMGLCWGGKIAVTFAAYHQDLIDGLILVAPAIRAKVTISLKAKIDVLFSTLFRPRKLFGVPLEDHMFTKNPKYLDFIKKDDLKLKKVTARFFFETGKMDIHFKSIAHRIHIPVLVLLAGEDQIVDNQKVKKWFHEISSKDKTLKIYHDCYHSLQFEKEAKTITNYIANWIRREDSLSAEEHVEVKTKE